MSDEPELTDGQRVQVPHQGEVLPSSATGGAPAGATGSGVTPTAPIDLNAASEADLDALPGVGPARKRALIQHFGSPERLLAASSEELEGVPGVPAKTGRQIYAALHKAGGA